MIVVDMPKELHRKFGQVMDGRPPDFPSGTRRVSFTTACARRDVVLAWHDVAGGVLSGPLYFYCSGGNHVDSSRSGSPILKARRSRREA